MICAPDTSRKDCEAYLERHRQQLRNVLSQHRQETPTQSDSAPRPVLKRDPTLSTFLQESENVELPGVEELGSGRPPPRVRGRSGQIYYQNDAAFCCLKPHHLPRRWCIYIVESSWFDPLILLTIGMNCFTMAWVSPLDPPHTEKTAFVDVCEWAYLYIFTVEMILKIASYGFLFTRKAYLTQPWCQLDFVIVALAWCAPPLL